jgi:hypothetical protein
MTARLSRACLVAIALLPACNHADPAPTTAPGAPLAAGLPDFTNSQPPGDYAGTLPASQSALAVFAWQEFVALNWPSSTAPGALRATPSTDATFLQPAAAPNSPQPAKPVWMGYYHRNEMLPADTHRKPPQDHTGTPTYNYDNVASCNGGPTAPVVTPCGSNLPDGRAATCFRTDLPVLDEASQLGLDYVFAQPFGESQAIQILFMAKANQASYDYVVDHGLYVEATSTALMNKTKGELKRVGGICQQTDKDQCDGAYCLPCGARSPYAEGTIHIKTAWRRLTPSEARSGRFFTSDVVVFRPKASGSNDNTCTVQQTWGLVGLHIIHKTLNFPTYVFASWEHVDNLTSNLTYQNTPSGGPHVGLSQRYTRLGHGPQNTMLPSSDVRAVNSAVRAQISQANPRLVWQYYQLVGVQGAPVDYADQGKDLPDYYLANNVIESNDFFQNFVGVSPHYTPPDGTTRGNNLFTKANHTFYDMGGCQGCHGNAQHAGADMSFLVPPFASSADALGVFDFGATPATNTARAFHALVSGAN